MPNTAPDLSKFDLNDPETRDWVKSNFKMDDPETQAHFEKLTAPQTDGDVIVPGTGADTFYPKPDPTERSIIGTPLIKEPWGIDPKDKAMIYGPEGGEALLRQGPLGLLRRGAAEIADYGAIPFQAFGRGIDTIAHEIGDGSSSSPGGMLKDFMDFAGGEGALFHGVHGEGKFGTPVDDIASPELRAKLTGEADDMFQKGATRADYDKWTDATGQKRYGPELDEALKARDEADAAKIKEFQDNKPKETTTPLEQEAQNFKGKPEPKQTDLFPTDESRAADEAAMTDKLQKEVEDFQARKDDIAPVHVDEDTPPSDHVNGLVDQVKDLTGDWTNRPPILVHENFEGLKGADPDAVGMVDEHGNVNINASKVDSPEKLSAVVYHEALGHNGLTQLFGDELDNTLTNWYNKSTDFRANVDKWMRDNKGAYTEGDTVARAADEVLAEQSERGVVHPTLMNQLKNTVKTIGRKMGLNLQYSTREIDTILGMAHDAVTKGKTVRENSFGLPRYMQDTGRRQKILDATKRLSDTKNGETKTTQPFPEEEPDYWRFRHVTEDGKEVTGTYTVGDGKLDNISVGSKSGPASVGPRTMRNIGRDLLSQHPEADRIAGYRISGARPSQQFVESGARFMRDRKKTLSPDSIETSHDVGDLVDYVASKVEDERTGSYSIPELKRMADNMGINGAKYVKQKGFTEQQLAAQLLAGKQLFANISESLAKDRAKLEESYSPSLHATMRAKLAQMQAIAARLDGDSSEVARATRVLREVTQSRSVKEQMRFMAEHATDDALSDPTTFMRFMDKFSEVGRDETPEAQTALVRKTVEGSKLADILNIPRTLRASVDLSAPLRQGLFLIGRGEFWKALPSMLKYFASKTAHEALLDDIYSRPNYPLMQKGRLSLTKNAADLNAREEQFMSRLASNLPGVKHSERAYSGFLDKLRADTFDSMIEDTKRLGVDFSLDKKGRFVDERAGKYLKDVSNFINNATGRGDLGSFNGSAPALANIFFSPRLMASRVNMMTYALKPSTYMTLNPVVRKNILRSYMAMGGLTLSAMMLAKMAGAKIETNPKSSDFGKYKIGNTRYGTDLSPYIVLAARLATNQTTPLNGETHELGDKFGAADAADLLGRFERSKLAPIPGTLLDLRTGKNVVGEKVDDASLGPLKGKTAYVTQNMFEPMFVQDYMDVLKDQKGNVGKAAAMSIPGLIGLSQQTFDETKNSDGSAKNPR